LFSILALTDSLPAQLFHGGEALFRGTRKPVRAVVRRGLQRGAHNDLFHNAIISPCAFRRRAGARCTALARTVEYFRIPRSVLTICLGKSTDARCGIIVNVTPLEPEWEGHLALEFSNTATAAGNTRARRASPCRACSVDATAGAPQPVFFLDSPGVTPIIARMLHGNPRRC
jgi:hypothetical protein